MATERSQVMRATSPVAVLRYETAYTIPAMTSPTRISPAMIHRCCLCKPRNTGRLGSAVWMRAISALNWSWTTSRRVSVSAAPVPISRSP